MAWEHVVLSTQWGSCLARVKHHSKASSPALGGERIAALCKLVAAACGFLEEDTEEEEEEEEEEEGHVDRVRDALELRFEGGALVLAHVGHVAGAQLVCSFVAGSNCTADVETRQCAAFAARSAFAALREQFADNCSLRRYLESSRVSAERDAASYGFADAVAIGPVQEPTSDLLLGFQDRTLSRLLRWNGPANDVLPVACACMVLDAALSSVLMCRRGDPEAQTKDDILQTMFDASCGVGDIRMLSGAYRKEWADLREAVATSSALLARVAFGSGHLLAVQPTSKRWCLLLGQCSEEDARNIDVPALDKLLP